MLGWLAWGWLLGCGGAVEPAPVPPPAPEQVAPDRAVLAPSPLELDRAVREAGVQTRLASLVPHTVPAGVSSEDPDEVALHTGVLVAQLLLGGHDTDKETLLTQIRAARGGMARIGTDAALLASIDRAILAIDNEAASREDLLLELDGEIRSAVPEGGWAPGQTTGPLLQAGAWLAGTHYAGRAILAGDDPAAADRLLARPEVAAWFGRYFATTAGRDKLGATARAVGDALGELETLTRRAPIGPDGTRQIVEITGQLLALI